jgi:hypothetical protein
MRTGNPIPRLGAAIALAIIVAAPAHSQPQPSWTPVDQALGRAGATQPDGVRRYGFPRSDLQVQLDGVTIKPALALGSGWRSSRWERAAWSWVTLSLLPKK